MSWARRPIELMSELGFQRPALFKRLRRARFGASEAKAHAVRTNKKALIKSVIEVNPRRPDKRMQSLLLASGQKNQRYGGWMYGCRGAATFGHKSRDNLLQQRSIASQAKIELHASCECKVLSAI